MGHGQEGPERRLRPRAAPPEPPGLAGGLDPVRPATAQQPAEHRRPARPAGLRDQYISIAR